MLRMPTAEGSVYFKASAPAHAQEAGLTEFLAHRRPESTAALLAVDTGRSWMLMRDSGEMLRSARKARLVDVLRRGGDLYYAVAPSRLYAEPKRLEELGYVTSVKRPGKTREKTFYTLTRKGLAALRRWTLEPPATPRIQNEAIPKLLSGDITGDDARLLETLLTLAPSSMPRRRDSPRAAHGSSRSPTGSATSSSCTTSVSA